MANTYTPYAHLTDNELLHEVWSREETTDMELELAERLDLKVGFSESLAELLHQCDSTRAATRELVAKSRSMDTSIPGLFG